VKLECGCFFVSSTFVDGAVRLTLLDEIVPEEILLLKNARGDGGKAECGDSNHLALYRARAKFSQSRQFLRVHK
jgi:hypothetical protein